MKGFFGGDWHDVLDSEYLKMEIVDGFQACILNNVMYKTGGREDFGSSGNEDLPKTAADKSKRLRRLKVR